MRILLKAAVASLAALPSAAAAQAPPGTQTPDLLDTFRSSCARVADVAAMRADALAAGWIAIEEQAEKSRKALDEVPEPGTDPLHEGP